MNNMLVCSFLSNSDIGKRVWLPYKGNLEVMTIAGIVHGPASGYGKIKTLEHIYADFNFGPYDEIQEYEPDVTLSLNVREIQRLLDYIDYYEGPRYSSMCSSDEKNSPLEEKLIKAKEEAEELAREERKL